MLPTRRPSIASSHCFGRKSVSPSSTRPKSVSPPSTRPASACSRRSSQSSSSSVRSDVSASIKYGKEVLQELTRILKHDTRYVRTLKETIAKTLTPGSSLKKPTTCICLGLGAVNRWTDATQSRESTVGLAQLVVLIAILEAFGIDRQRTIVYDPCFDHADRDFLSFLKFNAPGEAFGTDSEPIFSQLSEITLVYRPGCGVDGLYERNWTAEGLSRIVGLQGANSDASRALGMLPVYKVDGKAARVVASQSQNVNNTFLPVVDASLARRKEPIRRASTISDELSLPSIDDFLHAGIKAKKSGAHYNYINSETLKYAVGQTRVLSWVPLARAEVMPPAFWNLQPMRVGMLGRVEVDLTIDA